MDIDWVHIVAYWASGIVVGVISSMFGIGGGSVLIPLFTLIFGYSIHQAIAASLVIIIPTALVGALRHMRTHDVRWAIVGMMVAGGMIGSNLGVDLSLALPEGILQKLFALVLLFVAGRMWWSIRRPKSKRLPNDARHEVGAAEDRLADARNDKSSAPLTFQKMTASRWVWLALAGVGTGFISSLFGIGGGIIIVPVLTLGFQMSIHQAVTVSLFVIVPVSTMGAARHVWEGHVPWLPTLLVILGGLQGARFGVGWGEKISERGLKQLFSLLLAIVAVRMIF